MALGRLLLRFLIVPFGFCVAVLAAVLFVIAAHWTRFMAIAAGKSKPYCKRMPPFAAASFPGPAG